MGGFFISFNSLDLLYNLTPLFKEHTKTTEAAKAYDKEYRKNNPDKIKRIAANYYLKNKEKVKEQSAEYYERNKAVVIERRRAYVQRTKEQRRLYNQSRKEARREYELSVKYGLTKQDYDEMFLQQNGCCKICGTHENSLKKVLHVDHCHKSLKVRGLLCTKCNNILGFCDDNIEILKQAIDYLKQNKDELCSTQ